ncbi:MAG: acetyltransferase [Candidatus Saccharicenans sp.]|nr:acetyltransferase [Candidatus Saccharicenans sp.]
MHKIYIIGAGGQAKVVISTIKALNYRVTGIFDDDLNKKGSCLLDVPILGPLNEIAFDDGYFIIAVGDNSIRKRVFEKISGLNNISYLKLIHPKAFVDDKVKIGDGTVVFAGAIIQTNTKIGNHCIINTACSIDHDCEIGDFCHIAPGVHMAGGVRVGEGAFVGIGSIVIPNVEIGEWSQIGAGSVVVSNIPPRVLAYGNPARIIKNL